MKTAVQMELRLVKRWTLCIASDEARNSNGNFIWWKLLKTEFFNEFALNQNRIIGMVSEINSGIIFSLLPVNVAFLAMGMYVHSKLYLEKVKEIGLN